MPANPTGSICRSLFHRTVKRLQLAGAARPPRAPVGVPRQLGLVLAQVTCGRLQERGLVALLKSGGEALHVGDVLADGALADLRALGQEREEGKQQIIRRKWSAL
jgi:hypothetical protein